MQRVLNNRNPAPDLFGQGKNGFRAGDPQNGIAATTPGAEFFNAIQEELAGIVENAGLVLSENNYDQVYKAILKIADNAITKHTEGESPHGNNYIRVYPELPTVKKEDLIYVEPFGLMRWNSKWEIYRSINAAKKEYGWSADVEKGYLLGDGTYLPKNGNYKGLWTAAKDGGMVVPTADWRIGAYLFADVDSETFRLPDVRGRFDRNASMGSDVDKGRIIFSGQDDAMEKLTGSFQSRRFADAIGGVVPTPSGNGLFKMIEKNGPSYVPFSPSTGLVATDTMYFDSSFASRSANETRPINTAYPAWIKY